ncbi:MAG: thiamine pyrophosphate-binding protein [Gammaproteobacteria bacterium]|nr:thiamine pyrophosphate-binding protein [Gammaproteobacteria bacterium]
MSNSEDKSNDKSNPESPKVGRRGFLKGAAAGAAAIAVTPAANAQSPSSYETTLSAPTYQQIERDTGMITAPSPDRSVLRPGSDLIVQALKDMGIEFVASNNGSSFEGIQESIANYGSPPNYMPEFITCLHEETSVDMANGYGKAEGKPMCAMLHGTIGIQHAAMAIYQAFYSGTPMLLIAGRDDGFIQAHTANDMAAMVRPFTKWDAQPKTLPECLDALHEAYRQAMTPPTGPVLVVIDMEIQKEEARDMVVPAFQPPVIDGIDVATARDIAQSLLDANNPRINVGQLRTPEGVAAAVKLAEVVGASTSTSATQGPMSFPQRHPLCGPGADTNNDFVLGLESESPNISLFRPTVESLTQSRDDMGVGFGGMRTNVPASGRGAPRQRPGTVMSIDAEGSIPVITGEAMRLISANQKSKIEARKANHASANQSAYVAALKEAVAEKKKGWDLSPVSTARIYAELWPLIKDEDWCLASPSNFSGGHHRQLWSHNKPYSYLGGQGAAGMGYGAGACGGAALAARGRNRMVVNVQTDGDMNYTPGVLWSAAHHQLPMLTVMHNNRAWHQELMFIQYLAGVRGRGTDRAHIGTTLRDPFIDYAKMAEAYGMAGEGPIEDPTLLAAALKRGVESVKNGEPYMIDVVTQPR